MNTIKIIALGALFISTTAAFGHESMPHHTAKVPAAREQKDWGIAGDAKAVRRTITLRMGDDMRFTPRHIEIQEGETVRLRAENRGKVLHEIVLGTQAELDRHAQMMQKFPDMEHDAPDMAHVRAGQRGEIVWQFNRPWSFDFACLIPGHYESGMTGTITVRPRSR